MTKKCNLFNKDITILIVEDEILLAMGMKTTLLEFGYDVSGIEVSAQNAILHAQENKPDLILMDIKLKGAQSGLDAAKKIWNNYKIPIIFLTSYSDNKTIKEAMLSEPYAYLIKPCKDEELRAIIETSLHKHNYFFKNKELLEDSKESEKKIIHLENNFKFNKIKNVLYKDDEALKLTGNEIKLLQVLSDYINEPVDFNRIFSYIWREEVYDLARIRTLIYRLKTKIGFNLVENIYEMGYKLKVKND